MDMGWAVTLATVIGGTITGICAWILQLIKTRAEIKAKAELDAAAIKTKARADAIEEWVKYSSRQDVDIQRLQERCDLNDREIASLRNSERACLEKHADLAAKSARQEGVIERQTADIRRLQAITGDMPPGVTVPVVIIASLETGMVLDATAPIGPLLHWKTDDSGEGIVGKSIEVLIPERLRQFHRQGLQEIRDGKRKVDPTRTIRTMALRADGKEVAVVIHVSQWTSPMGSKLLTAEIRPAENVADAEDREATFVEK